MAARLGCRQASERAKEQVDRRSRLPSTCGQSQHTRKLIHLLTRWARETNAKQHAVAQIRSVLISSFNVGILDSMKVSLLTCFPRDLGRCPPDAHREGNFKTLLHFVSALPSLEMGHRAWASALLLTPSGGSLQGHALPRVGLLPARTWSA